ncbi:MAG: sialidase family protein [Chthoniobacteraceae bacterium]
MPPTLLPRLSGLAFLFIATLSSSAGADFTRTTLFQQGADGYHTYRIPSVTVTPKGTVLAFCEGRKNSGSDTGDIDLLLKRSVDGGRTFGEQVVLWDDGENTCGNPCTVIDRETGTIWLLLTHNLGGDNEKAITSKEATGTRTVWVTKSTDDGATWDAPKEITTTTKKPEWTWYATGPGAGIQLRDGRLIIPCDHRTDGWFSHVIYSDDHGATWHLGGVAGPGSNECEAVELEDRTLLLNMRNYAPEKSARTVSRSTDRGMTWSAPVKDPVLIEPTCQASIRRYSWAADGRSRILFSNPASTKRENLTVRLSYDECATWTVSKVLEPGAAAYSSLAVDGEGGILCLFEKGGKKGIEKIELARFTLGWLTDGQDEGGPAK